MNKVIEFTPNRKVANSTASDILQALLEKANKGQWDAIHEHFQPTVTYNRKPEARNDFIHRIVGITQGGDIKLRVDALTTDEAAQSLAGRLIITAKNADGATFEVYDMILLSVEDGKISRFYQIQSDISRHFRALAVPPFAPKPSTNPLSATELKHAYMKYISDINTRCMHTNVAEHFSEEVLLGPQTLGHEQLGRFFVNVIYPATAGLKYHVEELVVDAEKQQVAAKLSMRGVPENERVRENFGGGETSWMRLPCMGSLMGRYPFLVAPRRVAGYQGLRRSRISVEY
jgi:hypothetical protein